MMSRPQLTNRTGSTIGALFVLILLTARPSPLLAYELLYGCGVYLNGTPAGYYQGTATNYSFPFSIPTCSVPTSTSPGAKEITDSFSAWNSIMGAADVFTWGWTSTCPSGFGGANWIFYAQEDDFDEDEGGRTYYNFNFFGCVITGADVVLNVKYATPSNLGNPPCDNNVPGRMKIIALHEVGHTLGFQHDEDEMTIMHSKANRAVYCGADQTVQPHPHDTGAMRIFFKDSSTGHDVAVSQHSYNGVNANGFASVGHATLPTNPLTNTRCVTRGQTGVPLYVSVANRGTFNEPVAVFAYASSDLNLTYAPQDPYLGELSFYVINQYQFQKVLVSGTIPNNLANGIYNIFFNVMKYDPAPEPWLANNITYARTRLEVKSSCP